jgi:hypothetical protein
MWCVFATTLSDKAEKWAATAIRLKRDKESPQCTERTTYVHMYIDNDVIILEALKCSTNSRNSQAYRIFN